MTNPSSACASAHADDASWTKRPLGWRCILKVRVWSPVRLSIRPEQRAWPLAFHLALPCAAEHADDDLLNCLADFLEIE